jgi:hypothetical protein
MRSILGCLEIELTEGVASANDAGLARMFAEIRALGIKIAIDDFGTGYSSFSTLRQLAFDKIKIDREFVTEVHRRADSQAICQSIIALGRGLDIRVLAEGVETADEVRWLIENGCTHFQGYYFSRPLSSADFMKFANDRAGLAKLLQVAQSSAQNRKSDRMTPSFSPKMLSAFLRSVALAASFALAGCAGGPKPQTPPTAMSSAQNIEAIADLLNRGDTDSRAKTDQVIAKARSQQCVTRASARFRNARSGRTSGAEILRICREAG